MNSLDDPHVWDEDGVCEKCGFDGAEWHYWKHHTYEGKASDIKMPVCNSEPHYSE